MLSRKQMWKRCCSKRYTQFFNDEPPSIPKVKKTISFYNTARVTLIPKREEYIQCDLQDTLWYNEKELESIRNDYINEIKYNTI